VILSVQRKRWARPDVAAVLYTPDAVPSAEQSCAAPEAAAGPQLPAVLRDAVVPRESQARQILEQAQPEPGAQPRRLAAWDEAGQQPAPPSKPKSQAALESRSPPASPPPERPLRAAAQAPAVAELELPLLPESKAPPEAALAGLPEVQLQALPAPLAALAALPDAAAQATLPLPSSA